MKVLKNLLKNTKTQIKVNYKKNSMNGHKIKIKKNKQFHHLTVGKIMKTILLKEQKQKISGIKMFRLKTKD